MVLEHPGNHQSEQDQRKPDGCHDEGEMEEKIAQKKILIEKSRKLGRNPWSGEKENQPGRGLCRPHDETRLEISIVGFQWVQVTGC